MDQLTLDFYNHNATHLTQRYNSVESPYESLFPLLFKEGDKILDVGCGSGRDVARLLELGCDAYGLEPSSALRKEAIAQKPELKDRIFEGSLPHKNQSPPRSFRPLASFGDDHAHSRE